MQKDNLKMVMNFKLDKGLHALPKPFFKRKKNISKKSIQQKDNNSRFRAIQKHTDIVYYPIDPRINPTLIKFAYHTAQQQKYKEIKKWLFKQRKNKFKKYQQNKFKKYKQNKFKKALSKPINNKRYKKFASSSRVKPYSFYKNRKLNNFIVPIKKRKSNAVIATKKKTIQSKIKDNNKGYKNYASKAEHNKVQYAKRIQKKTWK